VVEEVVGMINDFSTVEDRVQCAGPHDQFNGPIDEMTNQCKTSQVLNS